MRKVFKGRSGDQNVEGRWEEEGTSGAAILNWK